MKRTKKKFDAVQNMRKIRNRLSRKFINLSFPEMKRYLDEQLGKTEKASKQRPDKS